MSPRLVLSLWRERWGDTPAADRERPYLRGRLNRWGGNLTHAKAWSMPGVGVFVFLGSIAVYLLLMTVSFSQGGQIAFSVFFVGLALYLRRHAGTLVTLMLLGMAFVVSTRYLYWRATETLGNNFNIDFVWGIGLFAAELYLWLFIMLRIVQSIWPITRASVSLPTDPSSWPTVDVFVIAHGKADLAVRHATQAALGLAWPSVKIKTYVLDEVPRKHVHEFADSIGVGYLVPERSVDDQSGLINFALSETHGDLIVLLDGAEMPEKSWLKMIVGWFVHDKNLGMLQTPHHFLAPMPSRHSLALCQAPSSPNNVTFALLRRSALTDVGGISSAPVTAKANIALQLQEHGFVHSYIGFAETKTGQTADVAQNDKPLTGQSVALPQTLFRVDGPFLGNALRWKHFLLTLHSVLQFYYIVPRLIFYTAPLAYLVAGIHLLQTTPELVAAYGLPYLVLTHFIQARLQGGNRLPLWIDLRESLLAWYLLIPTTLTLLRTELSRFLGVIKVDPHAPFDRLVVGIYGFVAILNLAALGAGILQLLFFLEPAINVAVIYIFWCVCNLMMLAALLAVAEETRHIRQQMRLLMNMPAMVQLSSGRTLACVAQNFPQIALSLKLPAQLAADVGSLINLSIFRGHDEYTFPARVLSQNGELLSLRIEDNAQESYRLFGSAVLSRGSDWPLWLPARDADHPLPSWFTRPFIAGWTKLQAAAWTLDKYVNWSRLGHWIGK